MQRRRGIVMVAVFALAAACTPTVVPVVAVRPSTTPMWNDDDRHPFSRVPRDDAPGLVWDGVDQTIFRPLTRALAVDRGGEAINVNAVDEVPSSSWFTNRVGRFPLDPEELASGPCTRPALDVSAPITVTQSKLGGASPGLIVKAANGVKYVMKFDDAEQAPRPTAADVIGSKVLYAAGFTTPCNRIVFFDRAVLRIDPRAKAKQWMGESEPFTVAHLELLLTHAARLRDGRYRASVSEWIDGAIGPWRYHDVRDDDPNDVVPHQDRRELRGLRLLAAWLGHTDARAQNTLDVWMPAGRGEGWVRHDLVDFSDCFGSLWQPVAMGRRFGHSYWWDVGAVASDFAALGTVARPWDHARFGASGRVFGYFDVESFDVEHWVMEYPNPAFSRMTERDAAWMARILAGLTTEHVRRAIRTGRIGDAELEDELARVLLGRRDRILRRYLLGRVSSLELPTIESQDRTLSICARDLAVTTGIAGPRAYWATVGGEPVTVHVTSGDTPCVLVTRAPQLPVIAIGTLEEKAGPLLVTVAERDGRPILVRVERPYGS